MIVGLGRRCLPGLQAFASSGSHALVEQWLDQLSTGVLPLGATPEGARTSLLDMPELDVDDPHDPTFYCSLAVGVISHGLQVFEGAPGGVVQEQAESHVLEFYSALGAVACGDDPRLERQAEESVEELLAGWALSKREFEELAQLQSDLLAARLNELRLPT